MQKYIYTAKSKPQEIIEGSIEAESEQDAVNKITQKGYFPVSIQSAAPNLQKTGLRRLWKVSDKNVSLFTGQLASLIESGVTILNGLTILSNQTADTYFKAVLQDIAHKIRDGRSLSESFSEYPGIFSPLYISMVHSGEVGGSVEPALKRLAEFMEKEEEFKSSLLAALTYPFFLLAVSIITVFILLGFVIPRLVTMFTDMGQVLPLPTQILVTVSIFLRTYWLILGLIIIVIVFIIRQLSMKPEGRMIFDRFKIKIPGLGIIILKTEISRFVRTLSLLISGGIPIVYALDVTASSIQNEVLKQEVLTFKHTLSQGGSLSQCLKGSALFPSLVTNIVNTGEETGNLEKALLRIAVDYEKEVDRIIKTLTRLLEPVIILIMGLVVGFIVIAMLLPIFQINLIVR
ncbi:MAG: type II secretion system F family protein [Candidatus Omnitrophota bacterium]|jgi:type II secretory pathway component PulF